VQVHLEDEVAVRAYRFIGGLDRDLQLVAQVVRVAIVVLIVIVRVYFKLHLIAHLFHLGTILRVSTVKEVIPVQSVIGGLGFVLVVIK